MTALADLELRVSRVALIRMVEQLARANRRAKREYAIFSFDDEALQVEVSGMRMGAPATGNWASRIRVDAAVIQAIRGLTNPGETVLVCVKGDRIHFDDDVSYPCDRLAESVRPIDVPLSSSKPEVLARIAGRSAEDLDSSGLGSLAAAAAVHREAAIEKAFRHLADFGVTRQDVIDLVDRRLRGMVKS